MHITTKVAVLRKPILQEDEGSYRLIGTFQSRSEAEAWIELHTREGNYFKPGDFWIAQEQEED